VKNWFNKFNRGRHSLVVPEITDAVREVIMQDRGILGNFLHQHIFDIARTSGRKKCLFSMDPHILTIAISCLQNRFYLLSQTIDMITTDFAAG